MRASLLTLAGGKIGIDEIEQAKQTGFLKKFW
jgi:hypothetical protein